MCHPCKSSDIDYAQQSTKPHDSLSPPPPSYPPCIHDLLACHLTCAVKGGEQVALLGDVGKDVGQDRLLVCREELVELRERGGQGERETKHTISSIHFHLLQHYQDGPHSPVDSTLCTKQRATRSATARPRWPLDQSDSSPWCRRRAPAIGRRILARRRSALSFARLSRL